MNDVIACTPVSQLFFHQKNIDDLQKGIQFLVWKYSKKQIGIQSEDNLYMAMRNTFNYTVLPSYHEDVNKMVSVLNRRVLYCTVKNVLQNIDTQLSYLKRRDDWKDPKIEMPTYVSNKGLNTRPVNNFF
jgi:hypothetical protein